MDANVKNIILILLLLGSAFSIADDNDAYIVVNCDDWIGPEPLYDSISSLTGEQIDEICENGQGDFPAIPVSLEEACAAMDSYPVDNVIGIIWGCMTIWSSSCSVIN